MRYGDKVHGWWVDGCYQYFNYTETKLHPYALAVKKGNPKALIALNRGVSHPIQNQTSYSKWEDYTCGESDDFTDVPTSRTYSEEGLCHNATKYKSPCFGSNMRHVCSLEQAV